MANPMARFVENVFTGIDLVPKILGDGLRDFDRPRVKAVDHKCLHRDGLVRALEGVHIEPGLFPVLVIAELTHFLSPPALKATTIEIPGHDCPPSWSERTFAIGIVSPATT